LGSVAKVDLSLQLGFYFEVDFFVFFYVSWLTLIH
jgi:hypothetical protein